MHRRSWVKRPKSFVHPFRQEQSAKDVALNMFYDTDEPLSRDEEMTLLHASQLPHLSQNYSFSNPTNQSSLSASGSHSIERLLSEQTSSSLSRSSGSVASGAVPSSRTAPSPPTTAAGPVTMPSNPRTCPADNSTSNRQEPSKMKKPGLLKKLSMSFWRKKPASAPPPPESAESPAPRAARAQPAGPADRAGPSAKRQATARNNAASEAPKEPKKLAEEPADPKKLTVRTTSEPGSPVLSSPATSHIFERSVQEIYPPEASSPVQPAYHNEDFIPPALEASANAITDSSLDPNLIDVVSLRHLSPRSQSMTESLTGSPTTPFDISGHSSPTKLRDRAASVGLGVGAITPPHDPNSRHILSFYSFADIVSAENVPQPLSPELSAAEPDDEVAVTMKDTLARTTGEISGQMVAA